MMALNNMLERFADGTTMHGIPKAIKAKSMIGRIFWSLVCICATSMFMLQFIQLLQKFYSYPKRVTIEVVPMSINFPSISLCNMRNLDNNIMNSLNHIFKLGEDPQVWATSNYTDDPFIQEYMNVVSKYYPMFSKNDSDFAKFATILTRTTLATNIDKDIVSKAGVPFKEFVVTCRFSGQRCNRTADFTPFFDPYYYNCFTYHAPRPDNLDDTLAEGVENGWSTTVLTGSGMLEKNEGNIRIIPGSHEYLSPMSSSEGVRVVIHPPNTTPYPHTEGFDVPPGYSVSFGVKARQNLRIGPPHGNCSTFNPFRPHDAAVYRLMSCQKQCLQGSVVKQCGCKDISLPGIEAFPDHKFCSADDQLSVQCRERDTPDCYESVDNIYNKYVCAKDVKWRMSRNATATRICGCYPPCNEITYDVTYSLSKWPAESFDGDEAYTDIFGAEMFPQRFSVEEDGPRKMEMYSKYFDQANRRKAMLDFSRLNVYIADSNVLKTEESEEYVQSQLLSDIGGQLGLWVGISVITLAEVLELIIDFCHYFSAKHGPYSQGKNFSKDPEEQERFQPQCTCANCQDCASCKHCAHHQPTKQSKNHKYGNGVMPMSTFDNDPVHLV